MGVNNLWGILDPCKKTLPLNHLQNKRVCVDLSCWMVQLNKVNQSHCALKDKVYLKGLFHRLRALIALNCSIIFVTDGSIPGIKVSTYRRRLQMEYEGIANESCTNQKGPLQRNMGSEFSQMIKEAKILGSALGVPCLDGVEEGEAQCALLDMESLCDGCFSFDSDIFLFGARTVYREICLGEGGYVVCYEMDDIERKLGLGRNSLIALAVLLGCDYTPGIRRLGPELACKIVKSYGESAVLQRVVSEDLSLIKKANCTRKQNKALGFNNKENIPPNELNINGNKSDLQKNHQSQQVIDAYLKPKCHSADSQKVQRVLGAHPFQRNFTVQTCHRYFEWPQEKTEEYILPKIAERDLRRFSNLRCTSSNLGVRLPLDKMPMKCPVAEIIKRRKAQGKECFEVSWEDIDGLGSSIVPAELVESACPEKIVEFEERLAEKKKPKPRKPRQKKAEADKSLNEVDTKLQELLLEIEGTTWNIQKYRLLDEPIDKHETKSDQDWSMRINTSSNSQKYHLLDEPKDQHETKSDQDWSMLINTSSNSQKIKMTDNARKSWYNTTTEVVNLSTPLVTKSKTKVETEIVDLLSPFSGVSPMKHRDADVIELSESETDVSPEHAKKARELRLFVAKIRSEF